MTSCQDRAESARRHWKADGSLVDDFAISVRDRIVLLRNAPSPAATSALAIAEHVVSTFE